MDLVTFTEEILNGKVHFMCSVNIFLLYPTHTYEKYFTITSNEVSGTAYFGKIADQVDLFWLFLIMPQKPASSENNKLKKLTFQHWGHRFPTANRSYPNILAEG